MKTQSSQEEIKKAVRATILSILPEEHNQEEIEVMQDFTKGWNWCRIQLLENLDKWEKKL